MGWMTIRRATNEDVEALNKAAEKFVEKHGLTDSRLWSKDDLADGYYIAVENFFDFDNRPGGDNAWARERKLWKAQVKRTLKEPTAQGIAYGYVGYHAD